MNHTENDESKVDLMEFLGDLLPALKRLWLAGLVLIAACIAVVSLWQWRSYHPIYEAHASFTVKVINPFYASASGYNAQTAEQMEKTFPYILSSNALREQVKHRLGVSGLPRVQAEVEEKTNIFTLRVRDADPVWANEVLEAVIACYPDVAEFVIGPSKMILLDKSGVPETPVNSYSFLRSARNGALIGAVLWIGLAMLLASNRNVVHDEEELKQLLSCTCLGALPATKVVAKDAACPLVTTDRGKYGFVDAVHLLQLHLERAVKASGRKIVLISSAAANEGKTTVSCNLAVALAQKRKRVLLVDCDLRNPSVAKNLGVSNAYGLSEFLEGDVSGKRVIQPTDLPSLHVIAGGRNKVRNPESLLSHRRMQRLLEVVRDKYDYIFLDTPPCGLLADASEIAELADCAVLVVRQDYASRPQILDGARSLTEYKLPLLGCVLNGTRGYGRYGYGYGYGYGYRYGYGDHSSQVNNQG